MMEEIEALNWRRNCCGCFDCFPLIVAVEV